MTNRLETPVRVSPQSTPSKRPKRRVESWRILNAHILHALNLWTIPFELLRKPPTANRWDPTLGTPRGDKYYNQYHPLCEVCPRDHGKVVESLQGLGKCLKMHVVI